MPDADSGGAALLRVEQGIGRLILNRPDRLNAFDATLHQALRDAMDAIEQRDDIRVLIISGAGKAFCAGQDLAERGTMLAAGEIDLHASLEDDYNPLMRRLAALDYPVIAAVNGSAAGAGAALALSCDMIVMADTARFHFSFARVGLGPDGGLSWTLPHLVGRIRALDLLLTAADVTAAQAHAMGLVARVVPPSALDSTVDALAAQLAAGPRAALATIKRLVWTNCSSTFDAALDAERDAQGKLGRTRDYRAAVTAFIGKTTPRFD